VNARRFLARHPRALARLSPGKDLSMTRLHRVPWQLLLPCALLAALLPLAGCSDNPVTPPPPPVPGEFPDTPDQLMANFQAAYGDLDSLAYAATLAPGFRFLFSPADITDRDLLTDHMTRAEELQSAYNQFSGEMVEQPGAIEAAISAILFTRLEAVDGWTAADAASGFAGAQRRLYAVEISIERPGNSTLIIAGQQEFFLTSRDSTGSDQVVRPYFQLLGQRDLTAAAGKTEQALSWGRIKLAYMGNLTPTAAIEMSDVTAGGDPTFRFDASASRDADSGLADEPYRWQFGLYSDWTEWSADPVIEHSYLCCPGEKEVFLLVRDRWGAVRSASIEFTVDAIFPDSEDRLLINYLYAYENQVLQTYADGLGAGFRFLFRQTDIENLSLPSDRWLRDEDLAGTANMFADQPSGGEPPVSVIAFEQFDALTLWSDATDPEFPGARRRLFQVNLRVVRPGSTTLLIAGQEEFFAAVRDSLLPGGASRSYWELVGQRDMTGLGKAVESASWGILKYLYR
jgi:hypothetical protein